MPFVLDPEIAKIGAGIDEETGLIGYYIENVVTGKREHIPREDALVLTLILLLHEVR